MWKYEGHSGPVYSVAVSGDYVVSRSVMDGAVPKFGYQRARRRRCGNMKGIVVRCIRWR